MIFKTREEIETLYKERINLDPTTSPYFEHFGIRALGAELSYKVELSTETITTQISEIYNPQSEIVLLSEVMYSDGYIRFQKPYSVSIKVKPSEDIVLPINQEYTDGSNLYICREETYLQKDVAKTVTLELGQVETIRERINKYDKYFKILMDYSYRDIYNVEVYKGVKKLNFSQNFAVEKGDYSLEVLIDGTMQVVIKVGNKQGNNIQVNDTLDVKVYTTKGSDEKPFSLDPIQDKDVTFDVTEITKVGSYEKYMTLEEMQDILRYDRNIGNTLVHNENYHHYILANVNGISLLKVWQEFDELKENPTANATNKIFLSYIPTTANNNLDDKIKESIQEAIYGKPVTIRTPVIKSVSVQIKIESKDIIPQSVIGKIKTALVGYYDDKNRMLDKDYMYRVIKDAIYTTRNISVDIQLSDKGIFKNSNFYHLTTDNVTVTVTRVP